MNNIKSKVIELNNVSYDYKNESGKIEIFKNINLNIFSGEMVALLGPSGSGKTTFLNCIGLLDKFSSGNFKILGKDFFELKEKNINEIRLNKIGFIFQNHKLFQEFSALENILIPSLINNINFKKAKKNALEILDFLQLSHRKNHRPAKLSGGEAQRIAIGRALSNNPKFILADEPTGNLDEENSTLIFNILKKITNVSKKTCIVATHNNFLAQKMDRILLIENKKLLIVK